MSWNPQHLTMVRFKPGPFPGGGRRMLVGGIIAVAVIGSTTACSSLGFRACSQQFEAAVSELEPHTDGDLSLSHDTDEAGSPACSQRVTTARTGAEVAAYYRAQLRAAGWRVSMASHEELRGQCSSGFGQCDRLSAAQGDVCFSLTTDTTRKRQALSADRTTLFFWTMRCSDVHRSQRSEFPGGPS